MIDNTMRKVKVCDDLIYRSTRQRGATWSARPRRKRRPLLDLSCAETA
jgi:hypothetical protein